MLRGIVGKNSQKIEHGREGMKAVYAYTTSGDGFYLYSSFIHHGNIAYNGGYGKSLFSEMTSMIDLLYGSSWEITDPNVNNIYQIAYDSYVPFIYKGEFMDMTRGREIGSPVLRNSHRIGIASTVLLGLHNLRRSRTRRTIKDLLKVDYGGYICSFLSNRLTD